MQDMGRKAKYEPMTASKKKKPPKTPSIEAVSRRADGGYFNRKRGKKNADKS